MQLEETLDKIHLKVTANIWLQLFTVFNRIILAIGFIPPSLKKVFGQPFTSLPDSNPVGHYFNALYQTGFYYEFIGWGQLIAAILLLIPRTAHLGTLIFFPIILNIMVLTNSVGFAGTNYITAMMFLACTYLVCWEYDRLKPILFAKRQTKSKFFKLEFLWLPGAIALAGSIGYAVLFLFLNGKFDSSFFYFLMIIFSGGFLFGLICSFHHKYMKIGDLKDLTDNIK